ncbi:MAG: radical SAM protein [uncultured bacterium]|nr:MAG: radical SAM protein [uncultured bacterium]
MLIMPKRFFPIKLTDLWFNDEISGYIKLYSDKDLRLNNYHLNEVGSFIWEYCTGEFSNEDIASKLLDKLEEEKPSFNELLLDVNDYLFELKENDLINWESEDILDVLFVIPPYPQIYSSKAINNPEYSSPPLGVAYLATVLKENKFKVAIYDMHIKALQPEDIIKKYRNSKPEIVAISVTTPTFPNALRIAKLLKAWDKNVIIVIGGSHATSSPEESIESDSVDYVVIGEGEITMLELANSVIRDNKPLSEVKGIAFKDNNGNIEFAKIQERIADLDTLPYPDRELLDIESYYQKGSIISSRGCPYNCNYCSCASIAGHTYRTHSVNYVLKEIAYLIEKYGFKYFDFHDDTFNLIPKRVFEFCSEIEKRKMDFKWGCFCRVTNFNTELATAMKNSGCEVVQFGVEAGNQKVLNSIKKKIQLKEVENAVIAASKAGIRQVACGFIIGHSDDTEETVLETIDFGVKLVKLGATSLTISVLTPYPGTEVYNKLGKSGIKLITKDWEQFIFSRVVIETKNITTERLRELYAKGVFRFIEATKR